MFGDAPEVCLAMASWKFVLVDLFFVLDMRARF
jgi:hypothetical protein